MSGNNFNAFFDIVLRFDLKRLKLYSSREGLRHRLNYIFKGIDFRDKATLDIGAGSGLFSLYCVCMGASSVTSLEPELAGGWKGSSQMLLQLSEHLPEKKLVPLNIPFQDYNPDNRRFDIILLSASINHLDEEACINLQNSEEARSRYRAIFKKLSQMASPGAKLIITDCSRYNLFPKLGRRNPLAVNIEWQKHQAPGYWAKMLYDFGFTNAKIRWEAPSTRYALARWFFRNRAGAYLTTSSFTLVMDKSGT